MNYNLSNSSLPHGAVFGCHATLGGALRDIQKTAAKETIQIADRETVA